ncbi:MAG: sigma-70 family RNA polymerase sigma factor, partial [Archangium sp.]|nr:sigma-70 family RNA polymerase sigma factor [Archangium sp.]
KQLTDELREVFVLQEIEGLSKREAAIALGVPEGTVASRLRRARETFDELLTAATRGAAS